MAPLQSSHHLSFALCGVNVAFSSVTFSLFLFTAAFSVLLLRSLHPLVAELCSVTVVKLNAEHMVFAQKY